MYKIILALCLIGFVQAQYGHDDHHHKDVDYYTAPHYKFEYHVHDPHTHDFKKQEEERKDGLTKGFYKLEEPHGNIRTLHYTIDSKHH